MQLHQPHDDIKAMCIINQALVPPEMPETVGVILDVDLYRTSDLPQDEDGIWSMFDLLRDRKDDVFEGCITEKTRELFF
jgi:uncharacterized protein (TIGR04255 family)